jgi:hypothetical protein
VKLKHRWRIDQNYLAGITLGQWWRLLRENEFDVDAAYWHRAAFITLLSLLNTARSRAEERKFGDAIHRTVIEEPPLFILGHWRTGTTLLHNLLSRDPRFAYPNLYEVVNPGTFLGHEDADADRWATRVPTKRPMDNMEYGLDLPQEDEFALAVTCLRSALVAGTFPRRWEHYSRYLTFDGVPATEVEEWKRALLWFLKKLTLRYRRRLVLKSPPHTARIRLLLELFPEARFVTIHRDPCTVFQSWRHTYDATSWFTYLQKPDLETIDDHLLKMGQMLFEAYFDQRHLIPPEHLVEIAYDDLEAKPVEVVEEIYARLGLPGFDEFRPRLQVYVDSLVGYEKNRFSALGAEPRARVAESWRRCFEGWGYPI